MTPDEYRTTCSPARRRSSRTPPSRSLADAAITLSCPGPAPIWSGDVPGQPLAPRPTGDFVFNAPSSMLFAPVVTMPLMSVGGMPVGVQLMGQQHEDARMTGIARWMTRRKAGRGLSFIPAPSGRWRGNPRRRGLTRLVMTPPSA